MVVQPYLCTTFNSFLYTKPYKHGVCHLDEDVVHTVDMDITDSSGMHVSNDLCPWVGKGSIKPSIAIWSTGNPMTVDKNDFTIKFQTGKCVLLKNNHIGWIEAKVPVSHNQNQI